MHASNVCYIFTIFEDDQLEFPSLFGLRLSDTKLLTRIAIDGNSSSMCCAACVISVVCVCWDSS